MTWVQKADDCDEHTDCTVIVCVDEDENIAWKSHAHNSTHAECRANPSLELVGGNSNKSMCDNCQTVLGTV